MTMWMTTLFSLALAAGGNADLKKIDQATAFLRGSNGRKIIVEKTVVYDLLDKTQTFKGVITLSNNKFRWETSEPEKSLIVFDGKTLLTLQYPPAELGGPVQVTRSRLNGKAKDQVLLGLLAGREKFSGRFKINSTKKDGKLKTYELEPLKADPSVRRFSIAIEDPAKLKEISYVDEVNNKTAIRIIKHEAVKNPAAKLFEVKLPKDAEVTDL
ncbi:MAG: outer membrane lipoprotein carrier protein LolA [Bdellovibrionaceae bacterium]|nr:outer membrane lipoprotein carrier protein LolA [Pseudobdellovibrionaceae bacterium]MBX3033594.1 outer membrane lipoprotein carrier protein LolA [Pseudobdellovibrionaceae bacterium]